MSNEKKLWYAQCQYYEKIVEILWEKKIAVESNSMEAIIIWGNELEKKFSELSVSVSELKWAIDKYLEYYDPDCVRIPDLDRQERIENIVYSSIGERDEYKENFNRLIESIKIELEPYIRKYHGRCKRGHAN